MRTFVSGLGAVTPIGLDVAEFWQSLCTCKDNFQPHKSAYAFAESECLVGRIPGDKLPALAKRLTEKTRLVDRTIEVASLYILCAAIEAVEMAELSGELSKAGRIAVIVGNLEPNSRQFFFEDGHEAQPETSESYQTFNSLNLAETVKRYFGIDGIEIVIHNTCASGNAALEVANKLIRKGIVDTAIVGASDAFSERVFAGFSALGVVGGERCRPFSRDRRYITISEGAAVAVLQSEAVLRSSPIAELVSVASSNDAHHPTNPSAEGIQRCLQRLFSDLPISQQDVDFIYAHGTGSRANDSVEADIFKGSYPHSAITAIKGTVGHLMGVAGALGIVASCLSAREGALPPNNIKAEELEYDLNLPTAMHKSSSVRTIVQNNAFGFGGSNSVSLFQTAE